MALAGNLQRWRCGCRVLPISSELSMRHHPRYRPSGEGRRKLRAADRLAQPTRKPSHAQCGRSGRFENTEGFRVGLFHRKVNSGRPSQTLRYRHLTSPRTNNHNMLAARFSRDQRVRRRRARRGTVSTYERTPAGYCATVKCRFKDIYEALSTWRQSQAHGCGLVLRRHFQQTKRGYYGLQAHLEEAPTEQASF